MTQTNKAGLEIVFRNPEPWREVQYSSTWLLCRECWEKVRRWRPFSIRSDWASPMSSNRAGDAEVPTSSNCSMRGIVDSDPKSLASPEEKPAFLPGQQSRV